MGQVPTGAGGPVSQGGACHKTESGSRNSGCRVADVGNAVAAPQT